MSHDLTERLCTKAVLGISFCLIECSSRPRFCALLQTPANVAYYSVADRDHEVCVRQGPRC